jgi:hypothetical protein
MYLIKKHYYFYKRSKWETLTKHNYICKKHNKVKYNRQSISTLFISMEAEKIASSNMIIN